MARKKSNRRFVSSNQAAVCERQPSKPCADCPFARRAIPGWLGPLNAKGWLTAIHGETFIDCHALRFAAGVEAQGLRPQCAGAAIFRANLFKRPRDPRNLILEPDAKLVFTSDDEFLAHHHD